MGRIEDALQKLQARSREARQTAAPPPAPVQRLAKLGERSNAHHVYGGRQIHIDVAALRQNGLLAPDADGHRLAEQYRVIKRPLLGGADPHRDPALPLGNLLMVASALSGEGKTFTCVNLCLSIAREKDWSVILADTDCSKPHLTQLFAAESQPGLLDLLRDSNRAFDSVVMPTDIPGVSILPVGARDQQSSELIASRRMRELCAEISAADPHRMVLFDSSPMLLTSEARVLASQVGQVVMVVRANHTPQHVVLNALEYLDQNKAIAFVLNQQSMSFGLGEDYGSYYGYGNYGVEAQEVQEAGANAQTERRESGAP